MVLLVLRSQRERHREAFRTGPCACESSPNSKAFINLGVAKHHNTEVRGLRQHDETFRWYSLVMHGSYESGSERGAMMYSLIESAKLNGVDPAGYLRNAIGRIADHPARRITELLQ